MTFLEMQTRVGELINQSVTDDNELVTETEVKANLNRGYQKVVNRIVSLAQDFYVRLAKADLVSGQTLYGLPTDFRKLIRVELDYSGTLHRSIAHAMRDTGFSHGCALSIPFGHFVYSRRAIFRDVHASSPSEKSPPMSLRQ